MVENGRCEIGTNRGEVRVEHCEKTNVEICIICIICMFINRGFTLSRVNGVI